MGSRAAPYPGPAGPALNERAARFLVILAPIGRALTRAALPALAGVLCACGGGGPLLHPAHPLAPGAVTVGAGLSGQVALKPLPSSSSSNGAAAATAPSLQDLGVSPGVSPWIGGRMGVAGDNDFGLAYTGRTLRLDGRHAFLLGKSGAISLGLGADAVMAHRPGETQDASGVFGGGADVPLLIGWRSTSDLYSIWFGPRGGFEILRGDLQIPSTTGTTALDDVTARHFYGMLVAGLRVGFRHVHVAIELDAAYHRVDGTFREGKVETSTSVQQFTLTPAGAIEISF